MWLTAAKGNGLEIAGTFARKHGQIIMEMTFSNTTASPISDFAIQFNKNSFALAPAGLSFREFLLSALTQFVSSPLSPDSLAWQQPHCLSSPWHK